MKDRIMTKKEIIKNFLRPTRIKIIIIGLMFLGGYSLPGLIALIGYSHTIFFKGLLFLFWLPDTILYSFILGLDSPIIYALYFYTSVLLRIIYYYLFACLIIAVIKKIRRNKKERGKK
ncbi:MAG: hypothetical protein WBC21_01850 [Minisyncoccales bacterium]